MSFEKELLLWIKHFNNELKSNCLIITEYDAYALMTIMDDTMWTFIRNNYDETYKLPYTGIS